MRTVFILSLSLTCLFILCCKYDVQNQLVYDYQIQINKPDIADRHLGDTLDINVTFKSLIGEYVHHINLIIYNKSTNAVVYNKPAEEHVDTPESYTYKDTFILSAQNGLSEGNWVFVAKVWGHEDFVEEVTMDVPFKILP